jgi:tetratricopeptide (TPR) repeat protein
MQGPRRIEAAPRSDFEVNINRNFPRLRPAAEFIEATECLGHREYGSFPSINSGNGPVAEFIEATECLGHREYGSFPSMNSGNEPVAEFIEATECLGHRECGSFPSINSGNGPVAEFIEANECLGHRECGSFPSINSGNGPRSSKKRDLRFFLQMVLIFIAACTSRQSESVLLNNSDFDIAVRLTDEALWDSARFHLDLAETAFLSDSNWAGIVECWNLRAHALTRRGHLEAADSLLRLADSVGQFRVGVESAAHASTLNKKGLLYHRMGRLEEAMELFQSALSIRQKVLPRGHVDIGWSYNNLGIINLSRGNHRLALRLFDSCYAILQKILPPNSADIALVLNNRGNALNDLGDYIEAEKSHVAALEIRQSIFNSNHPDIAQSYNNLGSVFARNRDFAQAIRYQEKSLQIRLLANPNDPFLGTNYYNLALNFRKSDSLDRALDYFQLAYDTYKKRSEYHKPEIARLQDEVGILYTVMGRYVQADSILQKAIEAWKFIGEGSNYRVGFPHHDLAEVYLRLGRVHDAWRHAELALNIFTKRLGEKRPETGMAWVKLGDVYAATGKSDSALFAYQQAIRALCPLFEPASFLDNPDLQVISEPIVLLDALRKKAELLSHAGTDSLLAAFNTYHVTVQLLDKIRGFLQSDLSKFSLADTAYVVFENGIEMAASNKRPEIVLNFMERSRAQILWENSQKSAWFNSAPKDVLEKERDLMGEINYRRLRVLKEFEKKQSSQTRIKKLKDELFEAEENYNMFVRDIESRYPRFAGIRFRTEYPAIGNIRSTLLNDRTSVIQYFWGQRNVWRIFLTPDTIEVRSLGRPKAIYDMTFQLLNSLKKKNDSVFVKIARQACHVLLPNSEELTTELIIIPDGTLFNIPFESLLFDSVESNTPYGRWPFLVRRCSIRYGPSLSLMILEQKHHNSQTPAAFAPGTFR